MFDTIKTNAKKQINNKSKQRIFIVSTSIATLIASGETTTTESNLFTSGDVNGTPTDSADTITIGDDGGAVDLGAGADTATGGDGVDTILGGAGADTISGGAGIDNLVVIGITVEGDYTEADLQDVTGTGVDLSALLTLAEINNHSTSDVEAGESIDGGDDGAILYTFGEVDFTDVTLNNITKIYLDSEVTLSDTTLQTLIGEGLTDLLGDGTIKAQTGQLDLDGVNVPENVTIKDSDGNIILPTFSGETTASVEENSTDVGTFAVTDASAVGDVTYTLSGTAADLFNINSSTGEVTFKSAPDYEDSNNDDEDQVYNISVTATDEHQKSTSQDVVITVTNINEAVSFAETSITINAAENQTAVTTVTATDIDGDHLTYTISGNDSDLFNIDETTGEITFIATPDYEAPTDNDTDNIYNISITATDEGGKSDSQNAEITVTNVNEAVSFSEDSITINAAENQTAVTTAIATDIDGDDLTYTITGDDVDLFNINETSGEITFKASPDFETPTDNDTDNVYNISITATDQGGKSATQNAEITVTNANDAPSFAENSIPVSVSENQINATTVTATDIDGDDLTYTLSGDGDDDGLFLIDSATGKITFKTQPDYESPSDDDPDNVYNISIIATDESDATATQDVVITVTNVNEAVSFAESSISVEVAENQSIATTVAATDIDGDDITYTLTGDVDDDLFTIDSLTGEITFNTPEDYEFPTHSNQQYSVTVEATDGEVRASQTVNITVTDVGAATDPAAPTLTVPPIQQYGSETRVNTHTTNAQQNSSVASLANGGYVVVWESSGQDGSGFGIYGQRFDNAGDEDGDEFLINNVTNLEQTQAHVVGLDDGGFVVVWQSLIISSDDNPFELLGRIFDDEGAAPENEFQINTGDFYVSDIDVEKLSAGNFLVTWSSDGQDGSDAGVFGRAYEADGSNPTDEFQINSHTDNGQSESQITALTDGGFIVAWNSNLQDQSQVGSYFQKFDADYMPDGDETAINTTTEGYQGEVAITALNNGGFVAVWIDDSAAGSSNGYEIRANVYNAGGVKTLSEFTVNQHLANEQKSPNVTSLADGSFLVSWESNGQDGDDYGVYGRRFMPNGDAIADEFLINTTTVGSQAEHAISALSNGGFVVTWSSSDGDGNGIYSQIFTVNNYRAGAGESYDFNILNQLPDGQTGFTLGAVTISGIPDNVSFTDDSDAEVGTLDGNTLTLTQDELTGLKIALGDGFDADASLTLSVTSANSEGIHTTTELTVALEIIYAPEFDNDDEVEVFNIEENTTIIDTINAIDEDSPSLTYSLTGEEDDALFNIDSISGDITLLAAEDYENPTNSNNEYILTVTATDPDGLTDSKFVQVNIIDADDAPQFASDDTYTVYMPDSRTDVTTLIATDEDDGSTITYSLTGGADDGLFNIDISTGKIDFDSIPNFDSPTDTGSDNIYNISVTATSDGVTDTRDVEIHVTDENAPTLYVSNEMARSGSEISLISLPDFDQLDAALTSLTDGNIVATWSLDSENDNTEIYGQKYTIDGIKIGDEFHINTHTENGQDKPTVTALEDGAFVVVWASYNQIGEETNSKQDIYGQMFDNSAAPTGNEFLVNTVTDAVQDNPKVTALTTGGFVVVWNGRDTGGKGILGQKYDAAGNADGVEFLINTVEIDRQEFPDVAALADGGFVVVWQTYVRDTESNDIYGRRYDSAGAVDAAEFQVNTHTNNSQKTASVTTLADGGFVVVWQSDQQDGGDYGIYGQLYTAAGATNGTEFSINSSTESSQDNADVIALNDGGFVVTWQSDTQIDGGEGVYGQRFDATGGTIDQEFQINSSTDDTHLEPAITTTQDGGFLVAWSGFNDDTNKYNIFGQKYENSPIFKLVVNTSTEFDIISRVQPDQDDILGDVTISGIPSGMIFTNNAGDLVGNLVSGTLTLTQAQLDDLEISSTGSNWGITELTLSVSSLDNTTLAVNATTISQISIAVGKTVSGSAGVDSELNLNVNQFWHFDGMESRDDLLLLFDTIEDSTIETVGNDILITNASGKGFLLHSVEKIDYAGDGGGTVNLDIADLYGQLTTDMTSEQYDNWLISSYEYDIA